MRHDPRSVAADAGALPVGDGWRMRLATAADNPALCALFREVDMAADLCLAEERDPDFFALLNAHSGAPRTVILEHAQTGAALGCASIIARDAWLDG
ncbi:MAG: hypothetical protein LPK85_05965, partial [Gammaproteobacteria bacterium]|nr:hypothetical protein [Gammaproteobacteria bacterium]